MLLDGVCCSQHSSWLGEKLVHVRVSDHVYQANSVLSVNQMHVNRSETCVTKHLEVLLFLLALLAVLINAVCNLLLMYFIAKGIGYRYWPFVTDSSAHSGWMLGNAGIVLMR